MEKEPIIGSDLKKAALSDSHTNYFLGAISNLRKIHASASTLSPGMEQFVIQNFQELVGFIPLLQTPVNFGQPFERVVINRTVHKDKKNARLNYYTNIKYPPESVAKNLSYNRANLPGQSVFYAGYGALATALETKPQRGDLYTTSKWQQKKGTEISYIPIFHNLDLVMAAPEYLNDWNQYSELLGALNPNVARVTKELYDFIAQVFTTHVAPDNKRGYILSALFANHFMNNEHFAIDGVYYPSVPSKFSSSNLALKPNVLESKFDLVEITESICLQSPSKDAPGWMSHRTANAIDIDQTKTEITWENAPLSPIAEAVIRAADADLS